MYQFKQLDDTIAAISTPAGQGGIGIVRLSGKDALSVADKMFKARGQGKPSDFKSFTVHYGWIVRDEQTLDEVLLTVMRAPRTYTTQDIVEINCHGGTVSLRAILSLAIEHGARLGEPGEFTKRAFLNGRIDLAQAESVLDIIQAKTDAFLKVSTHQLKGELSVELEAIRAILMNIYIEMEAIVNFPEDEIDAQGWQKIMEDIDTAQQRVDRLLESAEQGQILKQGIKIVIGGQPNVGKSLLLNVLLKNPRAIVSDMAGTTRDTIEEMAQIQGIPFQLIDTAGLLVPRDKVEEQAIERSHRNIQGADLVLLLLDASRPLTQPDLDLMDEVKGQNVMILANKCDLPEQMDREQVKAKFPRHAILNISALEKIGIYAVESAIVQSVCHGPALDTERLFISNLRHIESLKKCCESLSKSRTTIEDGHSLEFASEDIKIGINCLDAITGRNIDTDLIDNIFSKFCIGK